LVVAVAGAVDHKEVVEQVKRHLGELEPGELAAIVPVTNGLGHDIVVAYPKPTAQAHFMVASRGYAYDDVDEPAGRLVAAILGRGMSSRLFTNVRERQGLAYTVFAEVNPYVDTGLFEAYAGVNLEKITQALDSVLHELEVIREVQVSNTELDKAKQQLIAGLEMSLESNGSIADRIATQMVLLGKVRSIEDTIARIESVTPSDVLRVAAEMLSPARLRFAIIAPEPDAVGAHFVDYVTKFKEKE
jgi:predicted Zn-dependent peptidase